jgi:hypothetical protein
MGRTAEARNSTAAGRESDGVAALMRNTTQLQPVPPLIFFSFSQKHLLQAIRALD